MFGLMEAEGKEEKKVTFSLFGQKEYDEGKKNEGK